MDAKQCHYVLRPTGAVALTISELCLSFSPHPNILDGNFNLVPNFIGIKIFQKDLFPHKGLFFTQAKKANIS